MVIVTHELYDSVLVGMGKQKYLNSLSENREWRRRCDVETGEAVFINGETVYYVATEHLVSWDSVANHNTPVLGVVLSCAFCFSVYCCLYQTIGRQDLLGNELNCVYDRALNSTRVYRSTCGMQAQHSVLWWLCPPLRRHALSVL